MEKLINISENVAVKITFQQNIEGSQYRYSLSKIVIQDDFQYEETLSSNYNVNLEYDCHYFDEKKALSFYNGAVRRVLASHVGMKKPYLNK